MKSRLQSGGDLILPVGERDHRQGGMGALATLVEYGDYQCEHCGAAYSFIKEAQRVLGEDLLFIFRNFPLTGAHPFAALAAEAAEAAGSQGRFWEMHDLLYENQDNLGEALVVKAAQELRLDSRQFIADLQNRKFKGRVREDFMSGVRSGVSGTPGFFINGSKYMGPWDGKHLIAALKSASHNKEGDSYAVR